MTRDLLDKYFNDECTPDELEQVLNWFQTPEGKDFLARDIEEQELYPAGSKSEMFLYKGSDSERLFRKIQLRKSKGKTGFSGRILLRVAVILFVAGVFSLVTYHLGQDSRPDEAGQTADLINYTTAENQQMLFSLPDGSKIRLNENSTLVVSEMTKKGTRDVYLTGEAYFEVYRNEPQPFVVHTEGADVVVLGTKFNVRAQQPDGHVQVAVLEGRVSLQSTGVEEPVSVLLAKNDFGLLNLGNNQITIEKAKVENYLSWMNRRLVYSGESLKQVSRQLENLFNLEIGFGAEDLSELKLTADFEKGSFESVIETIAKTFGIRYRIDGNKVTWLESN